MPRKTGQPRPMSTDEARRLVRDISREHGLDLSLIGELAGGDGPGAWALSSAEGGAVVKVLTGRDVSAELAQRGRAIDVLRGRRYPAPRLLCCGSVPAGTYLVQERLAGSPMGAGFTRGQLDEVLRLHELHRDIGVDLPGDDWPLPVTRPVLEGGDGFCVIESMREYSSETEDLLDVLQDITRTHSGEVMAADDIVHFDFTYANILAEDGRVTGVIDWEAAMLGDRGFDLATFAFYVFDDAELRRTLLTRATAISGQPAISVYLAHIMFRQTEWCTRYYGEELVRFYLRHCRTMLSELQTER